ncbi:Flp family type IVb pilin [Reyranella sp. CPCC 100927]|nr:Flp family type IVb pilin [Reyranella sp. CPCC 100927]
MSKIRKFLKNEQGATMIEYALLAALISIAAIAVLPDVRDGVSRTFTSVKGGMDQAAPAP